MPADEGFECQSISAAQEALKQLSIRCLLLKHRLAKLLDGAAHLAGCHALASVAGRRTVYSLITRSDRPDTVFFGQCRQTSKPAESTCRPRRAAVRVDSPTASPAVLRRPRCSAARVAPPTTSLRRPRPTAARADPPPSADY